MKITMNTLIGVMVLPMLLGACFQFNPAKNVRTEKTTMTAVVEAINLEERTVTVRNSSGQVNTINVNEDVKHLDKLKVGDHIRAVNKKSVAVRMALSNDMEIDHAQVEQADAKADKPAVSRSQVKKIFATVVGKDVNGQTVTLMDGAGNSKEIFVKDPEKVRNVKLGDKIHITYAETYSVSVVGSEKN